MSRSLTERGVVHVSRAELADVPTPERTESYMPVAHAELVDKVLDIATGMFSGFNLVSEDYALARFGQHMFSTLRFEGDHNGMHLSLGIRNSLDKSMPVGFVGGSHVICCSNMMLVGDIKIVRKHTTFVWRDVENKCIEACKLAYGDFDSLVIQSEIMRKHELSLDQGFAEIGIMFGHGIISASQITLAKEHWANSPHQEFKPRNAWSLYNSLTEAMKTTSPSLAMQKHTALHRHFESEYVDLAPLAN